MSLWMDLCLDVLRLLWNQGGKRNNEYGLQRHDMLYRTTVRGIFVGSAKTDPVRFKWGFGEGLLKDKFAFFEAYKSPTPERRKLLAKRPFL